ERSYSRRAMNWLLLFIPVTLVLERLHATPPLVFFSAALSIVPIAAAIVRATEQIAARTGDAVGGLLNATFGNAPELIIAAVALRAGLFDMVRASLIGAILANLLLALGGSFFLGGLRHHVQEFNPGTTRLYTGMMLLATTSLMIPSAFSRLFGGEELAIPELRLNLGLAAVLLLAYVLYLVFMLRTHPDLFRSAEGGAEHEGPRWSTGRAVASLLAASVAAAWMSEILVGAAEGTGKALHMSDAFIGLVFLAVVGGAAESGSAIAMARKGKMDLSVGIALGSCIQISLFIAPALVLASLAIAPRPFTLAFSRAELGTAFLGVIIGTVVAGDGKSNWYKGVLLMTFYAIVALLFYFAPG
ncbi:MAG TPA: calcium/proton exchanger, partial [Myxococcales bacterium]|nr:calcium/proton exchanger [Myxococcales bacterium]